MDISMPLMLDLMGRTAMRVGEVMTMRPRDLNIDVSTIAIEQPKSGRYGEVVYLPQRMMRRLDDYVREQGIGANDRIFPFNYTTAYRMVKQLGGDVGVKFDHTILDDTRQHKHRGLVSHLKWLVKLFYAMLISPRLKDILERSAWPRLLG